MTDESFKQACGYRGSRVFYHFACWPRLVLVVADLKLPFESHNCHNLKRNPLQFDEQNSTLFMKRSGTACSGLNLKSKKNKRTRKLQKQRLSKCFPTRTSKSPVIHRGPKLVSGPAVGPSWPRASHCLNPALNTCSKHVPSSTLPFRHDVQFLVNMIYQGLVSSRRYG